MYVARTGIAASRKIHWRTITVDKTKVPNTDQTNFPVLFSGTYAWLATRINGGFVRNANGYDIEFYSDAALTTKLNWEIERYVATTGEIQAWIKIPTLTTATDYVFYIKYGNIAITTFQGNVTGTWSNSYTGVWHVPDGTTLGLTNSQGGTGLTNSNTTAGTGQIDGGAVFNGTNAKLSLASWAVNSTGTLSCWWKPSSTTSNHPIFVTYNASPLRVFGIQPYSDGNIYAGWYDNGNDKRVIWTMTGISTGTWYYITLQWTNAGTTDLRINGVSKGTTASLNATYATTTYVNVFGQDGVSVYSNFSLDEMHFASVARSNDWITTEYNNQSSPSTFYTIGSQI